MVDSNDTDIIDRDYVGVKKGHQSSLERQDEDLRVASSECKNVPTWFPSATGIINAVVQMNRETQGDKQAGVPAS